MARILFIAYTTYESDGRVKRHAEALAIRGHEIDVICLESERRGETQGVNIIRLPLFRYRGNSILDYLFSYFRFIVLAGRLAMRRHLKCPYDMVITCTMPDTVVLCGLPLRLMGAKLLLDIHDTMPELYQDKFPGATGKLVAKLLRWQERICAKMADRVLAVHELHRRRLIAAGIPASKLTVVMNSPDPRIFRSIPKNGDDGFTLVCHGTLTKRLGLEVALHALSLLKDKIPRIRLRIIGEGDYQDKLKMIVNNLGLNDIVVFQRCVPLEMVPRLLSSAHVGIVPHLATHATHLMLPVKLLEYISLGIPVVASRLTTIEYYFGPDVIRYFTPGSEQELADAIQELYENPDLRNALAMRAQAAAQRFNWMKERERLYSCVEQLLGQTPSAKSFSCYS